MANERKSGAGKQSGPGHVHVGAAHLRASVGSEVQGPSLTSSGISPDVCDGIVSGRSRRCPLAAVHGHSERRRREQRLAAAAMAE